MLQGISMVNMCTTRSIKDLPAAHGKNGKNLPAAHGKNGKRKCKEKKDEPKERSKKK